MKVAETTMGTNNLHFLGVTTHIWLAKNLYFSWFWGPKVGVVCVFFMCFVSTSETFGGT